VAPFNDDGEVVPVDRFREPAEIEVVCEQHPWTHAWIAVLDHPYYAQQRRTEPSASMAFRRDDTGFAPGIRVLDMWTTA